MKRLNFDFTGVSQVDWARLAAFIDGEGHIQIVSKTHKHKGRVYPQEFLKLIIVNTDVRLIQWLVRTFGGVVSPRNASRNIKWKDTWAWNVGSAHGADLLRGSFPYFIIKRDQAELALAFCATLRRRGVKGTPQSVRDERAELRSKLRVLTSRGPRTEAVS